jgi:hypothetical protein
MANPQIPSWVMCEAGPQPEGRRIFRYPSVAILPSRVARAELELGTSKSVLTVTFCHFQAMG